MTPGSLVRPPDRLSRLPEVDDEHRILGQFVHAANGIDKFNHTIGRPRPVPKEERT